MSEISAFTTHEVVEKTTEVIHLFYERKIEPFAAMLGEDFVWIGAFETQYLRGKEAFLRSIEQESQEVPIQVSQEEFQLLAYQQGLWVVYGRFTVTAPQPDGGLLLAKVRNTFVWQQVGQQLLLLHIHGSHARDVPMEFSGALPPSVATDKTWFQYIKDVSRTVGSQQRIVLRDQNGTYHFLLPSELGYAKAEAKQCVIFTGNDQFSTKIALKDLADKSPLFLQIHRSFVVNIHSVRSVRRYEVKLLDGTVLPVGKERYGAVQECLQASLDVHKQLSEQDRPLPE